MSEKEYIEREALIRYAEKQEVIIKDGTSVADAMRIQGNVFRRCVETCPAADVAPKSEVAREIIDFIKGRIKAMEDHTPGEILDKAIGIVDWILLGVIGDLETKYTEGER